MRAVRFLSLLAAALLLSGCEELSSPPAAERPASPPAEPVENAVPQADATAEPGGEELPDGPVDAVGETLNQPGLDQATAPPAGGEPTERVAAEAGVGVKGQSLEPGSMITEPARAFFRAEQRIVFQNVERALQLYKATNDRVPQSTEEFMEQVIRPNAIQLPTLPRGHAYVFDPEQEKLLVERPGR